MSGSLFGSPKTFPKILSFLINLSFLVIDGSSDNPTPKITLLNILLIILFFNFY